MEGVVGVERDGLPGLLDRQFVLAGTIGRETSRIREGTRPRVSPRPRLQGLLFFFQVAGHCRSYIAVINNVPDPSHDSQLVGPRRVLHRPDGFSEIAVLIPSVAWPSRTQGRALRHAPARPRLRQPGGQEASLLAL